MTVPNVKLFELSAVKALKPGSEAATLVANELKEQEKGRSQTEKQRKVSRKRRRPYHSTSAPKRRFSVHDGETCRRIWLP